MGSEADGERGNDGEHRRQRIERLQKLLGVRQCTTMSGVKHCTRSLLRTPLPDPEGVGQPVQEYALLVCEFSLSKREMLLLVQDFIRA